MRKVNVLQTCYVVLVISVVLTSTASAYIGPGIGAGVVGVVLGIVGSLFLALAGIVWYPLKRILRRAGWIESAPKRGAKDAEGQDPNKSQ